MCGVCHDWRLCDLLMRYRVARASHETQRTRTWCIWCDCASMCRCVCVCVCTNANLIEKLIYTKTTSGLAAQSAILPPTVYNMRDFSSSSSPESIRISMAVHLIYMRFAFRIEPSAVFVLYIYSYMMLARFARYADGQQLDKATTTKVCAFRMYDKRIESCGRYSLCFTYLMVVHKPDDNLFESDDNRHG